MASPAVVLLRIAPLITATAGHICTFTQTLAFATFAHLSVPTAHAPSIRAWSRPYLFSLGPIVMTAHPVGVALLIANILPDLAVNAGLDPLARQLYGVALVLEVLSISMVGLKYKAAKACWEGSSDAATVAGLSMIQSVNGWRLVLVDLPNWVCVLTAVVRALGS